MDRADPQLARASPRRRDDAPQGGKTAVGGEGTRRDILARAEYLAEFTPEELALTPPKTARREYARLVDQKVSWALTDLKRQGALENPRWSHWQIPRAAPAPDLLADDVPPQRLRELATMPYAEYLETLEWQHTRLAALRRAGHRCQLDATHETGRLDVHHNSYHRRGAELSSDLVVLCSTCHERFHEPEPEPVPRRGLLARLIRR